MGLRLPTPDTYEVSYSYIKLEEYGGPGRIRTDNPLRARQMLSHLELQAHINAFGLIKREQPTT